MFKETDESTSQQKGESTMFADFLYPWRFGIRALLILEGLASWGLSLIPKDSKPLP